MKLPIEWPRQQQANSMATANLGGSSHGQEWPTSRGGQPKPKREERRSGSWKGQKGTYILPEKLGFWKEIKGEEGDRVKVLSAANGACLGRTLPEREAEVERLRPMLVLRGQ